MGDQTDHPGFTAASGQGAGDVLGDPLFAGPWTVPPPTNLALAKGSPAVGAGATLAAVTHDFLGSARPATGTDIGAFQYGATPPVDGGAGTGGGGAGGSAPGSSSVGSGGPDGSSGSGAVGAGAGGMGGSGPHQGAPPARESGACGCAVAEAPPAPWLATLLAFAPLARRRRRW